MATPMVEALSLFCGLEVIWVFVKGCNTKGMDEEKRLRSMET